MYCQKDNGYLRISTWKMCSSLQRGMRKFLEVMDVHCLGCGDGVTGVYIYQNSLNCTLRIFAVYESQYFIKPVKIVDNETYS